MYQYKRVKPRRGPSIFLACVIILTLTIAAGITVLFLRGFKISDVIKDQDSDVLVTPTIEVWLVKTPDYATKIEAYKVAVSESAYGFAEYVFTENQKWSLVEGVYLTSTDANAVLQNTNIPENTVASKYNIIGKEFKLDKSVINTCREVLQTIENAFDELVEIRDLFTQGQSINNANLEITNFYNFLKESVATLQEKNLDLRSDLLATIIYSANQNILALHNVIFATETQTQYLSVLNTAIVMSIFSLDNF